MQVETLTRDLSKITQKKRMAMLKAEAPELLMLVTELRERLGELRDKVNPLRSVLEDSAELKDVFSDDLVDFLEAKQQILLSYCVNVVFYLALKSEGRSVKTHPVLKQLLELRYVMEKMRPLDSKLKYQLDRLIKYSTLSADERQAMILKPNPSALRARGAGDDSESESESESEDESEEASEEEMVSEGEDEEEEDAAFIKKAKKNFNKEDNDAVYRPPKMAAMPYKDSEAAEEKKAKKLGRMKAKLKDSEMLRALQEEFGSAPQTESNTGITGRSQEERDAEAAEDERRDFEEERFVRLVVSKKDKKAMKRAQKNAGRMDALAGVGDVGEFDEVSKLMGSSGGAGANLEALEGGFDDDEGNDGDSSAGGYGGGDFDAKTSAALARAMTAFGDHDGEKKRRRAPDGPMDSMGSRDDDGSSYDDEDDDAGDMYENFVGKKKAYKSSKKDHYSVAPRFGSEKPDNVEDGKKRAASYDIMKNRGLTPHRKKENRNPRVKKREQFRKAVIKRKGAVRDVQTGVGNQYAGETTGINKTISRSRTFKD
jgi:U3 small nucleolar RNA-associated protein 3